MEQRTDEYLSRLYEDISMLHSKRWKEEEIRDIKKAVRNMMQTILVKAYSEDNLLKDQFEERLISVGSMEEGTKVIEPDEFDFSFVIPEIDFGAIKIDEYESEEDFVFGTFIVHRKAKILSLHYNNRIIDKASFLGIFSKRIIDSCQSLLETGETIIKGDTGTLKLLKENDNTNAYISQQGVAFHFEKRFIWTENVTQKMLKISVDLAPVIKPPHPVTAHHLDRMVGYFVVPFKSTVMMKRRIAMFLPEDKTEGKNKLLEMAYVKTFVVDENERVRKMRIEHPRWFMCYVLMKYFTNIGKTYDIFTFESTHSRWLLNIKGFTISRIERPTHVSSYNWKTMTLTKAYEDKEDNYSITECFNSLTEPFLTSNTVKIPYLGDPCIEEIIYATDKDSQPSPTTRVIKELRQILEKVSKDETMTYEEFKKEVEKVVSYRLKK